MKEFEASCPKCGRPMTTEKGKMPRHTIGVVRDGKVVQVKCPGTGERPN